MADRSGVLDAQVFEWLEADFDLWAVEAALVEGGVDREATLWRVRDVTGRDLAVKWTSGGTVASLAVSRVLAHAGVDGIVAPLSASDGRLWSDRGGRRLVVLPWVHARVALDADLEECHWMGLGRLLAAVHSFPATATTDHAVGVWSGNGTPDVVCHADPHLGNVLLDGEDGVWLLDWDDAVIGPREQDLLFVLDGGVLAFAPVTAAQTEAFFTGYGPVEIDRQGLAYHRSIRALEDLVDFALEVLAPDRHPRPTREAAYRYLRGNLAAGGLTEAALRSLHEVGLVASIPALRPTG